MHERSLAEALLASTASTGKRSNLSVPWGPSVEDALLGTEGGPSSMTEEDSADLSAKVKLSESSLLFLPL